MALVRWQQNRHVPTNTRPSREDIECFLEEALGYRPRGNGKSTTGFTPRVDLKDTPEAFVLRADVPGVDKADLDLTINSDVVTLKGERKLDAETESDCYYCRESYDGSFERTVPLPQPVLADNAEAKLVNGVLTVTLPKAQPRTAIKIAVN